MKRFKTFEEFKEEYGDDLEGDSDCVSLAFSNCLLFSTCFGRVIDDYLGPGDWIEDWMITEDTTPHNGQGFVKPKCECGAEIAGSFHSDWCPMYRPVWK